MKFRFSLILFFFVNISLLSAQWTTSGVDINNDNTTGTVKITSSVEGFQEGLWVEKTTNSASGKNVATFAGNASSASNPDANLSVGLWQKTNENNNYALVNYFNALGNHQAFLGCRFLDHNGNKAEFTMGTGNGAAPVTRMIIKSDGKVGIGTLNPASMFAVNGKIESEEVQVKADVVPDYVFKDDYQLMSLPALENYINDNGHLPRIQTQEDVDANRGLVKLGELNISLMEKVEELTLHLIEMNKRLEKIETENAKLKETIEKK